MKVPWPCAQRTESTKAIWMSAGSNFKALSRQRRQAYWREGDVFQLAGGTAGVVGQSPDDEVGVGSVPVDDEKPGWSSHFPCLSDQKVSDVIGEDGSRHLQNYTAVQICA